MISNCSKVVFATVQSIGLKSSSGYTVIDHVGSMYSTCVYVYNSRNLARVRSFALLYRLRFMKNSKDVRVKIHIQRIFE